MTREIVKQSLSRKELVDLVFAISQLVPQCADMQLC